ncbi:hypothetical protein HNR42_000608 [Deinobacterium chartae]|uniref:Uncharacterized protein n=1 Tax=Deinobacterium chartae TaxID=521158 RepID=A0A841HX27_9DEIO|nr:hypothetical protein [Deinobacterium chartae]MBB6097194.1 hypothetical protein [Deinobacterium chartae]
MKHALTTTLLLALPALAQSTTLEGTLFAPQGGNVKGTVVIACVPDDQGGCDEASSRYTQITASAAKAAFKVPVQAGTRYGLVAWQDLNGSGAIDDGDAVAALLEGQSFKQLSGPKKGLELCLSVQGAVQTQPQANSTSSKGAVPQALLGTWVQGSSTGVDYYNRATGSWAPPSGSGALYRFRADGSYDKSVTIQLSQYTCGTQAVSHESGRASFQGREVILTPTSYRLRYTSSCNPANNYETTRLPAPSRYGWAVEGDQLKLTFPDGNVSVYGKM